MGHAAPYEAHVSCATASIFRASLGAINLPSDELLRSVAVQKLLAFSVRSISAGAFDDLIGEISTRIARPPFFVRVRNLETENPAALLIAISAMLGRLMEPYQQPWSKVVRDIRPRDDRGHGGRVLNEFLHTDGTDWPTPNDYTCLYCVHPDPHGGGQSRLLCVDSFLETLHGAPHRELLEQLDEQPLPWKVAPSLGGEIHWAPAISISGRQMRWLRATNLIAARESAEPLPAALPQLLETFEAAIEAASVQLRINLNAGDMLLVDNRRALHGRTAIRFPETSPRHLLRVKVAAEGNGSVN